MKTEISMPERIKKLEKDSRGYPIPYIVLRDAAGIPHFAANDSRRQVKCLVEKLCPICGVHLGSMLWFVGGPLSAFHEHGTYMDTAMHYTCMTYALKVCPYLAAPQYLGQIQAENLQKKLTTPALLINTTQMPGRPQLFVAVASRSQIIRPNFPVSYVTPIKPYIKVEFWRGGGQVPYEDGMAEAQQILAKHQR